MMTNPLFTWFLLGFILGIIFGVLIGNRKIRRAFWGMFKRSDDDDDYDEEE